MPRRTGPLFLLAPVLALLAACATGEEEVDYEAVCRDHVARTHPLLEPELVETRSPEVADGVVTVRLGLPGDPTTGARCDIPAGTTDVITAGVRDNA
jgi:hypothetical protein